MLTKRIIPCLDIDRGRVVKGVSFVDIRDAGDPVELAALYDREGADELVFLDITASSDGRDIMIDVVKQVSEQVFIPLTVGGGVRSVEGVRALLEAGADKVSLNTAAVQRPQLIAETSDFFGCQCIVVAIDYKRLEDGDDDVPGPEAADPSLALDQDSRWEVYTHGGRNRTGIDAVKWARRVAELGAGELLVTSMDADGRQDGYDLEYTREVSEATRIPVIASGGAGELDHVREALDEGKADAALAASIFHFGKLSIRETKDYLEERGIPVRPIIGGAALEDVTVRLDGSGLAPAIVQHAETGEVLMLGYVSAESLRRTLETGEVWFYSRSRAELWRKGETSGSYMRVRSASVDCDGDTLLLKVDPEGPACHTGERTCFFTPLEATPEFERADTGPGIVEEVFAVIQDRKRDMPEGSYTADLLRRGVDRVSQKVIEEAGETALAGARGDRENLVAEAADLVYHTLVLLAASDARPEDVWEQLRKRRR